ncbi:IS110 family transposase, partial [Brucella intermedia]
MSYTSRFVGIDISKSSLDVCVLPDGQMAAYQNTPAGIADFLTFVVSLEGIERLVLEPTGGYERHVVAALQAARLPVAKVNAKQVRQFARAGGQLSKTDRIDAFILADYARRMETRILLQRSSRERVLADFVSRYRQLSHMIVQEKNRREKASGQTKDWVEESLNFLLDQRQTIVDAMTACLKA